MRKLSHETRRLPERTTKDTFEILFDFGFGFHIKIKKQIDLKYFSIQIFTNTLTLCCFNYIIWYFSERCFKAGYKNFTRVTHIQRKIPFIGKIQWQNNFVVLFKNSGCPMQFRMAAICLAFSHQDSAIIFCSMYRNCSQAYVNSPDNIFFRFPLRSEQYQTQH